MASTSAAATTKVESLLDQAQVLKASTALVKHLKSTEKETLKGKQNLLEDAEDGEDTISEPIWLTLTTKKHIIDKKRFKPAKIPVPNSLNTSANTKICLITASPQRTYKDIVASPAFPAALASRVTKVVDVKKLKKKFNQYEARRKLLSEYDLFVADDRIITKLPELLGATFYKSTTKRPIPIDIAAPVPRSNGKRTKRSLDDKKSGNLGAATPQKIGARIEEAIHCALITLTPSTNTSVRIGYAHWSPEKLAANITAVSEAVINQFVALNWKGVKAIHIKSPNSIALPIWLADELWADDEDVLDAEQVKAVEAKASERKANVGKKRKAWAVDDIPVETEEEVSKKQKTMTDGNDDKLDKEIAARKESLRKQKAAAVKDDEPAVVETVKEAEVPKKSPKSKKRKAVTA